MKTKLFFLVWAIVFCAFTLAPTQEQKKETGELKGKKSSLVISREVPYAETMETVEQLNDSTVKKTVVTTFKTHRLTTRVDASRQSFLGFGGSPQIPEMTAGMIAQGNSAVPSAVAEAIGKDPKNIQLLEKAPWPGATNDTRVNIELGGGWGYRRNHPGVFYLGDMEINSYSFFRAMEDPEYAQRLLGDMAPSLRNIKNLP